MKPMRALVLVIIISVLTRVAIGALLVTAHYEIDTFALKYFIMLFGVFFITSAIQRIITFMGVLSRQR